MPLRTLRVTYPRHTQPRKASALTYTGLVVEESLEDRDCLRLVRIAWTTIEPVSERHQTPWLEQWTLHRIALDDHMAESVARVFQQALDTRHPTHWYVDYRNHEWHYIIFKTRIFKVNLNDIGKYDEVRRHGAELGIPDGQLDFIP